MIITNTNSTQYINVNPEDDFDIRKLLNAREVKNSDWYIVENCLVNQIILGIDKPTKPSERLSFAEGLKDYQVRDVMKMTSLDGICNFNRMGYGKTVEAARAMRELGIQNGVIVAPKSVLYQWVDQIKTWYPEMKDRVGVYGAKWVPRKDRIVVINYEKLVQESTLQRFKAFRWDVVIADEAHRIKNRKSKRSIAVRSIPRARSWPLTGTPVTRLVDDLWAILNFASPEYSGKSYWNFVYYFCEVEDGFFGQQIVGLTKDEFKLDVLHKLLDRVAIRNPDLELTPGKDRSTIKLQMGNAQKKLYRDAKNLLLQELPEDMTIPNGAVLVTRLMQITSDPSQWNSKITGVKFEYILDLLKDNPTEKFVIFSKFESTISNLWRYLKSNGIATVQYTGKIDPVSRFENKQRFINNANCQAILGTIGAMGEGVDGLQKCTNCIVFIDREWSPELVAQAEDRVNRIGQEHLVHVMFLECEKTFDQHVTSVNLKKSSDIRRALLDE